MHDAIRENNEREDSHRLGLAPLEYIYSERTRFFDFFTTSKIGPTGGDRQYANIDKYFLEKFCVNVGRTTKNEKCCGFVYVRNTTYLQTKKTVDNYYKYNQCLLCDLGRF